jgi:hypothetical protein
MTISSQLEGRARAFRLDADYCSREADTCADNERKYRQLKDRERAYLIAADELMMLADQWRGGSDGSDTEA